MRQDTLLFALGCFWVAALFATVMLARWQWDNDDRN